MTARAVRSASPSPEVIRRVRRDPRFRQALHAGTPDPGWRSRGVCLRLDPEVFFPNPAEDPSAALAACRGCPVQGACLAAALTGGEWEGVWGDTTPAERRAMQPVWAIGPS